MTTLTLHIADEATLQQVQALLAGLEGVEVDSSEWKPSEQQIQTWHMRSEQIAQGQNLSEDELESRIAQRLTRQETKAA